MRVRVRMIRKKNEIHALNGTVIDSLESNSVKDAPSINVVNKALATRTLVKNGDFKLNFGGKSEYTQKGESIYKWNLAGEPFDSTLTVNDDGTITIQNNSTANSYFSQNINISGKHIANVKVLNIGGTCELYFGGNSENLNLDVGENRFLLDSNANEVGIRLRQNSSITLEYIDLFEGNIELPHIEETYQEAFERCKNENGVIYVTDVDVNNLKYSGLYVISGNNQLNTPDKDIWFIRVEASTNDRVIQWATIGRGGQTYNRNLLNGTWSDWLLI